MNAPISKKRLNPSLLGGFLLLQALFISALPLESALAASPDHPYLVKSRTPGYVRLEHAIFSKCQVFADRVESRVHHATRGEISAKTTPFKITEEILKLIAEAAQGEVVEAMAPADLPTTTYSAYLLGESGPQLVRLLARGERRYENQSPAAKELVQFLDQHCTPF